MKPTSNRKVVELTPELELTNLFSKVQTFDPRDVYYNPRGGKYYIDKETHFREYTRDDVVQSGVDDYLSDNGITDPSILEKSMKYIQRERAIDWAGNIAGQSKGLLRQSDGINRLILQGYDIPEPDPTQDCPLHKEVFEQCIPDPKERAIFLSWLHQGVQSVVSGTHNPSPMFVLAGKKGTGKSLISHICTQALGGRVANPVIPWSGRTQWNDDLISSEFLLLDDTCGKTDIQSRKQFGINLKENIYAGNVMIHTRGQSSFACRPCWQVMVCCNETEEDLAIIPPMDDGLEDKICLLRLDKVTPSMPSDGEHRATYQKALRAELPAFLAWITSVEKELPEEFRDERQGVKAYHNSYINDLLFGLAPEFRLDHWIRRSLTENETLWYGLKDKTITASKIEAILKDRESVVCHAAEKYMPAINKLGAWLTKLSEREDSTIAKKIKSRGVARYSIDFSKAENDGETMPEYEDAPSKIIPNDPEADGLDIINALFK